MTTSNRNEVAVEIEEILSQTEISRRTKWCIYRAPDNFKKLNGDAYTPKVISIGPFYYGDERLKNMQIHKWEYFKYFVQRTRTNLDDLVSFIETKEPCVRLCYAENLMFDKKQLVKIILLDACFIIELFSRAYYGEFSRDDALFPGTWLSNIIYLDLLLLENQLPFFVIKDLFNLAFSSNILPSFLDLTFNFFDYFNIQRLNSNGVNVRHFMDLLRYFHLQQPSSTAQPRRDAETEKLYFSATKLHEAGLRFKVSPDRSRCLLRLQFSGRALEIPQIMVDSGTEVLFGNMMAFEQCHCPFESYITDYVVVLNFLTDTDKDVDVLVRKEIIINRLDNSDEVAKLFDGLAKKAMWVECNSDYVELCKKLNEFYRNPLQKMKATLRRDYKATLRRDYCNTPWKTVATIAGIFLLFLTLIQTIFSVIQTMQKA